MTDNLSKEQLQSKLDELMSQLMTTEEAAELWGLSQDHIKRLCADKLIACKRGKTWLILKDQSNPKQV
ncbi:excisionase family DNA binding protein [Paenibacillus amylolyticus]|uniref:Excisionase family DNA binding protein n=1 Tax=Paenibacillus amylolyticus TaxID=1451 RepID=A0AAP5H2D7_PAEAM|nr:helix-turn-helix domain-containing protein [Paenibacillus amylolyticus]MDR6725034.1 excisionase family DNA binding protein [Paenibacillus amylolyticus]